MASWKIPCAYGLAHLFEREHVTRKRLAVGKLVGAVRTFGIEIVEQTRGAFAVSVFADVARLPGLVDVAALVELNDLVVGLQVGEGGDDVRQDLLRGFAGLLLCLGDGVLCPRNLSLVPVKDRERHVVKKRTTAGARE